MLADFHMHTRVSDGIAHPLDMVRVARAKGLGAISITDHNTFRGSIIAAKLGVEGVIIVYGSEVRTEFGDVVVLCSSPPEREAPLNLFDLVDFVQAEACTAFPAHPYDIRRLGIGPLSNLAVWPAVEGWNAASDPISNAISWLSARNSNKTILANSDAHVPQAVGAARNFLPDTDSADDVLECIIKGCAEPLPGYSFIGIVHSIAWSLIRSFQR